jgi:hypothetical protein
MTANIKRQCVGRAMAHAALIDRASRSSKERMGREPFSSREKFGEKPQLP